MANLAPQFARARTAVVQRLIQQQNHKSSAKEKMKKLILLLTVAAFPLSAFAADLTGTWKAEFDTQIGVQKYTFTLKQDGDAITGKAESVIADGKNESSLTTE